jgi:hypothetical protein
MLYVLGFKFNWIVFENLFISLYYLPFLRGSHVLYCGFWLDQGCALWLPTLRRPKSLHLATDSDAECLVSGSRSLSTFAMPLAAMVFSSAHSMTMGTLFGHLLRQQLTDCN